VSENVAARAFPDPETSSLVSSYYHQRALRRAKLRRGKAARETNAKLVKQLQVAEHTTPPMLGSTRRIEYVLYPQGTEGAPRNQRGRLTLEGYTPEEAISRLRELGIMGPLESQVPFTAIMRSSRRDGVVQPLERAYVRREASVPEAPFLLTHGLTGRNQDVIAAFERIASGGGLLSIAERFKHGIRVTSSSPAGDIRSGIDHVVFCAHDGGGTCGSGSKIRIGLRFDTLMRRDVVLSERDYGGMGSRYSHYLKYKKGLQAKVGEPASKNLYDRYSPAVRQAHLNGVAKSPGSAEYNLGGAVSVEDMAVIGVDNELMQTQVTALLDRLLREGRITRAPVVVLKTEFNRRVRA